MQLWAVFPFLGPRLRAPTSGTGDFAKLARGAAALLLLGAASPVARLEIEVDKLRSSKGVIQLCLTSDPKNFPPASTTPAR